MTEQTKYKNGEELLEAVTPFLQRQCEPPRLRYVVPRTGSTTHFEPFWALYASVYDVSHCGSKPLPIHVDDAAAIWREYVREWAAREKSITSYFNGVWEVLNHRSGESYIGPDLLKGVAKVVS